MNVKGIKPLDAIPDAPGVDRVGVHERAARFKTRSIKNESKIEALKMALSMMDLTTLEGKDTPGKVKQLCYKAMHPHDAMEDIPQVAAVCVFPTLVGVARKALGDSPIQRRFGSHRLPLRTRPLKTPPSGCKIGRQRRRR